MKRQLTIILFIAGAWFSSSVLAGIVSEDANNGGNGNCSGVGSGAPAASSHEGNPIDVVSGNKFQVEPIFSTSGEFPLRFSWFYNSRHFQTGLCATCNPGGGGTSVATDVIGQWTHSYSSHLMIDVDTIGTGSATVELRRPDGKSIWFVEQNADAGYFVPQEPESCGFLRSLSVDPQTLNYYTGYEYKSKTGLIERYSADGYLLEVENQTGVKHVLTRDTTAIDAQVSNTVVTVTRNLGGSFSFDYTHANEDRDYEVPCFRCASGLTDPDGNKYEFSHNLVGLLSSIKHPSQLGEDISKTFLYEISDESYTGGCNAFWRCETALTGIIDEEGHRYATWDYMNEESYYPDEVRPSNIGWVYKSYHGDGEEIDDHVELIGYTGDSNPKDDRVVVRQYAHKVHYNLDHWDTSNENYGDDKIVRPRVRHRQDLRLDPYNTSAIGAENIEKSGIYYEYYDAGTPTAQAAISDVTKVVELNGVLQTRTKSYKYDAVGAYTVIEIVETSGTGIPVVERVTSQRWNTDTRQLLWRRVSKDGTDATAEREVNLVYYSNGRLKSRSEKDLTNHTFPYSTNGRVRAWNYEYTYFDVEQTRPATMRIDGPRDDTADWVEIEYDSLGNVIKFTNSLGHAIQYQQHNGRGQPQRIVDQSGAVTELTYNTRGQITSTTRNGVTAQTEYYKNGLIKKVINFDQSWLEYRYTSARKIREIINDLNETIRFDRVIDKSVGVTTITMKVYDKEGVIVGQSITKEDALGRVYEVNGDHGQSTKYHYYGRQKSRVTQSSHPVYGDITTEYYYDGLNRLQKINLPREGVQSPPLETIMKYNVEGLVTAVQDPSGLITQYQYDGFGFLMQRDSPSTSTTIYTYDLNGNVKSQIEGNNVIQSYTYDASNRPLTKSSATASNTVIWEYDLDGPMNKYGIGKLSRVTDASGITNYSYDQLGKLLSTNVSVNVNTNVVNYSIDYTYDAFENLISMRYPSGQVVKYNRDKGRIVSMESTQNGASVYLAKDISYQPFGGVSQLVYGNGLGHQKLFDSDGRLSEIKLTNGTENKFHQMYYFDNFNNIASIDDVAEIDRSQVFFYDQLHRIEEASGQYGTTSYMYDAVGNRSVKSDNSVIELYNYGERSQQLLDVVIDNAGLMSKREFTYDASGNLVNDTRPTEDIKYQYDDNNRLTRALKRR